MQDATHTLQTCKIKGAAEAFPKDWLRSLPGIEKAIDIKSALCLYFSNNGGCEFEILFIDGFIDIVFGHVIGFTKFTSVPYMLVIVKSTLASNRSANEKIYDYTRNHVRFAMIPFKMSDFSKELFKKHRLDEFFDEELSCKETEKESIMPSELVTLTTSCQIKVSSDQKVDSDQAHIIHLASWYKDLNINSFKRTILFAEGDYWYKYNIDKKALIIGFAIKENGLLAILKEDGFFSNTMLQAPKASKKLDLFLERGRSNYLLVPAETVLTNDLVEKFRIKEFLDSQRCTSFIYNSLMNKVGKNKTDPSPVIKVYSGALTSFGMSAEKVVAELGNVGTGQYPECKYSRHLLLKEQSINKYEILWIDKCIRLAYGTVLGFVKNDNNNFSNVVGILSNGMNEKSAEEKAAIYNRGHNFYLISPPKGFITQELIDKYNIKALCPDIKPEKTESEVVIKNYKWSSKCLSSSELLSRLGSTHLDAKNFPELIYAWDCSLDVDFRTGGLSNNNDILWIDDCINLPYGSVLGFMKRNSYDVYTVLSPLKDKTYNSANKKLSNYGIGSCFYITLRPTGFITQELIDKYQLTKLCPEITPDVIEVPVAMNPPIKVVADIPTVVNVMPSNIPEKINLIIPTSPQYTMEITNPYASNLDKTKIGADSIETTEKQEHELSEDDIKRVYYFELSLLPKDEQKQFVDSMKERLKLSKLMKERKGRATIKDNEPKEIKKEKEESLTGDTSGSHPSGKMKHSISIMETIAKNLEQFGEIYIENDRVILYEMAPVEWFFPFKSIGKSIDKMFDSVERKRALMLFQLHIKSNYETRSIEIYEDSRKDEILNVMKEIFTKEDMPPVIDYDPFYFHHFREV